ncbi:MAG: hypothetical protein ABI175_03420, partial [Polyangiales bacterium]
MRTSWRAFTACSEHSPARGQACDGREWRGAKPALDDVALERQEREAEGDAEHHVEHDRAAH